MWWWTLGTGCLLLAEAPEIDVGEGGRGERGDPVDVAVQYSHACVVYENGEIGCGDRNSGLGDGDYERIEGGLWGTCGLQRDGALSCSDEDDWPDRAEQVDIGGLTGCAITDGRVSCWGSNSQGVADPVGGDGWERIGIGTYNGCATGSRGVECWGEDGFGALESPEGAFVDVAVADFGACAVAQDGEIQCWGDDPPFPPQGEFTEIEGGDWHYCALAADGRVDCWGDDDYQQSSPPNDTFVRFDSSGNSNCGITDDAEVVCWGDVESPEP